MFGGEPPQVNVTMMRTYSCLLRRPGSTVEEIAALVDLPVKEVRTAVADMRTLRLAKDCGHDTWAVVSPQAASEEYVQPLEADLQERRSRLDSEHERIRMIRRSLADLAPLYHEVRRSTIADAPIELLSGTDRVRAALTAAALECQSEVLAVQPGSLHDADILMEAAPRDIALLERGAKLRFLYHHAARTHLPLQAYVSRLVPRGAEVRTVAQVHERMIIFDRTLAFLAVPDGAAVYGDESVQAVVIRDSTLISHLCGMFEAIWLSGIVMNPRELGYGDAGNDLARAVAALLAEGHKDEVIARRLGISVRSCRRHVAGLSQELGAQSRFQAGVLAVRAGLVS